LHVETWLVCRDLAGGKRGSVTCASGSTCTVRCTDSCSLSCRDDPVCTIQCAARERVAYVLAQARRAWDDARGGGPRDPVASSLRLVGRVSDDRRHDLVAPRRYR
jgi:hypothetical protein